MGSDWMHADGGIADACEAPGYDIVRANADQWIGVPGADQMHAAQSVPEPLRHLCFEVLHRQRAKPFDLRRRQGYHHGSHVCVKRQQRQRLPVIKPFPGDARGRLLQLHPANQHGAAEIMHSGGKSCRPPGRRKPAVCGDCQPGTDLASVIKFNPGGIIRDVDALHAAREVPCDAIEVFCGGIGRPAQRLV